jgi:hypothetical protein
LPHDCHTAVTYIAYLIVIALHIAKSASGTYYGKDHPVPEDNTSPFLKQIQEYVSNMTTRQRHDFEDLLGARSGRGRKAFKDILSGKQLPSEDQIVAISTAAYGSSTQGPGRELVDKGLALLDDNVERDRDSRAEASEMYAKRWKQSDGKWAEKIDGGRSTSRER